jgi:hypothetical protein
MNVVAEGDRDAARLALEDAQSLVHGESLKMNLMPGWHFSCLQIQGSDGELHNVIPPFCGNTAASCRHGVANGQPRPLGRGCPAADQLQSDECTSLKP